MRAIGRAALALALVGCASAAAGPLDASLPSALCAGWRGEKVCEVLSEDAQIRVLRCTFPHGVGHEPHYHPPNFGYVLEGESVMRNTRPAGTVDQPLKAGASFSSDVEVRHTAENIGAQTYLIVEKKYLDRRPADQVAPGLCAAP